MEKNEPEIVINIVDLKKRYKLGTIGGGTLTRDLQSWWAKVRGKEDPNTIIGTETLLRNKSFMALNGINLEVQKGDTIGIIGGNGAGKSTLLKILSRVTAPTDGKILIDGRISSMLEVGTGFNGELTGRENIYMNGAILGMSKAEVDSKIEQIISFSECEQFIDTPVKRYSSGMYVKLAFSVAAHLDSEILIMDEVLAVGDMKFQDKCLEKMRNIANEEGRTILYVSHNMNTIRQLCNRCIYLENGKVKYDGNVEDAIRMYMKNEIDTKSHNDLRLCKRGTLISEKIKMQSITSIDKDVNILLLGENLKLKLDWISLEYIENLPFRFIVYHSDSTPVAMCTSEKISINEISKINSCNFEFNSGIFAPGKYYVDIIFFEPNNFGAQTRHDHAISAFSFEVITKKNDIFNIVWSSKYWGNVHLKEMKL